MKGNFLLALALGFVLSSCTLLVDKQEENNQNLTDLESIDQLVKSKYPFLEYKHINWDSLVSAYRTRVEQAQGDEIYTVFHSLLCNLKDGHIQLITEGGFPMQTYIWPRQKDYKSFSQIVVSSYLNQKIRVAGSGNLAYGMLSDQIGYIYLSSFDEGMQAYDIDFILQFMSDSKGLIFDVRNNSGGSSNISDIIISRFIQKSITETFYYSEGVIQGQQKIEPSSAIKYLKPMVILVNGASFSCAELLPDLLRQRANVTIVGDTTGGGGGSTKFFSLPSGKRIRMPFAFFKQNKDGKMVEWNGILPDVVVTQSDAEIAEGRDKQLEKAIKILNTSTSQASKLNSAR